MSHHLKCACGCGQEVKIASKPNARYLNAKHKSAAGSVIRRARERETGTLERKKWHISQSVLAGLGKEDRP